MHLTPISARAAAAKLCEDASIVDEELHLGLGDCTLRIRSNSSELIAELTDYFGHVAVEPRTPDLDIVAIERAAPDLGIDFVDWKREPGKTGRKDAYVDIPGARLVLKVQSGMVFLQSETYRIAAGPCLRYESKVINFINAQYMNWLQNRDWLICHASGLVKGGRCLAIAGFSGGGKSTLMLRLMDDPAAAYLTNDRLFIRRHDGIAEATGIPKLPRVNPGTIVHNPTLHGLLTVERREELLAMPREELWHLEDKYDVHIDRIYGAGRIIASAPLSALLVLNWQLGTGAPVRVKRVDLRERRELLGALMKSPGPFYQFPDGSFFTDTMALDEEAYLSALDGVAIFEASGGIDFEGLAMYCFDELMGEDK